MNALLAKLAAARHCGHRWWASRPEVPTAPVLHVCDLRDGHDGPCRCACKAEARR